VANLGHEKKEDLASAFEWLACKLAVGMPAKVGGASLGEMATAAGICVDKMLLLRGEPTAISEIMSDEERHARIRQLGTGLGYFEPKPN
jgi:hypothetical protein